jgi:hypothetical protein
MRTILITVLTSIGAALLVSTAGAEERAVDRAFEHYERIRSGLAADSLSGVAEAAQALAPLAGKVAGEPASRAANAVAQAKDLKEARAHFGDMSEALVPKFLEARVAGTTAFVCTMNQKRWVQRGSKADNPYYGKAMATCGTVVKPKGSAGSR